MRRWNGWGDEGVSVPVAPEALVHLERLIGPGRSQPDASLEETLARLPASRLSVSDPLLSTEPAERLRHARGQSLPDWIALRSGRLDWAPDAVAHPSGLDDIRALFRLAAADGTALIPYGGGTSVAGHLTARPGGPPTIAVALDRMSGLGRFDERSGLATFGPGTIGPRLEAELGAHGRTLGHFPQSYEASTIGGWVATRSSGQQSLRYGRIESLFAGGHLEAPAGGLALAPFPASAAGPDLRQLVLGSEGRLGIVTEVTVRTSPRPAHEGFLAAFLPDFAHGLAVARALADERAPLSMIRVSTAEETATLLAAGGRRRGLRAYLRYLGLRGIGSERCMLIAGVTGDDRTVRAATDALHQAVRDQRGVIGPAGFGRAWAADRFRSAYQRNGLWDAGYAVDTVETASTWDHVPAIVAGVTGALRDGLAADGERVHAFSHASHVYPSGSSVYTTYLFRLADDPDETLRRWRILKAAASRAIVEGGGTISHQHGVGRDHASYLPAEIGPLGIAVLADAARRFDPGGLMNRGALLDDDEVAR
ncbi:MAG: FAD-binding oxidoreductase [Chloroflexi bacterium]|nr:MAG: FAD-binding oxidoreductase [Chloroflexota bacterium]